MVTLDFFRRVDEHPWLELVYRDATICIVRCAGPAGTRLIRLGLWAVRRMYWQQIAEAFRFPPRERN